MPTYTYNCGNCDYRFDLRQRFDDPDPTICPNCDQVNLLKRVYMPVGVVFKGSGFYATDNKSTKGISTNGSKPKSESSETTPESNSSSSESKKTTNGSKKEKSEKASPDS